MKTRRVLVAPLDWGLGHASRCVPIIKELLRQGCEVMVGGSGDSLALIKIEFPALKYYELAPYRPIYSASSSMMWKMAEQLGKFIKTINREHRQIEQLVKDNKIDLVISDNRFGCWTEKARSIFITHQVNILLPRELAWMGGIINYFNKYQIKNFHDCWIPDWSGPHSLAGSLSQPGKLSVKYIGPVSRFEYKAISNRLFDILVLLSGPEPQRHILEEIMFKKLKNLDKTVCVVRGVRGSQARKEGSNFSVVDFLSSRDLQSVIQQSELLISRSGYSTIMDMTALGGKAVFIPTPGQPEQEYLAHRFHEKGISFSMPQDKFDLNVALTESKKFSGFQKNESNGDLLTRALQEVLTTV